MASDEKNPHGTLVLVLDEDDEGGVAQTPLFGSAVRPGTSRRHKGGVCATCVLVPGRRSHSASRPVQPVKGPGFSRHSSLPFLPECVPKTKIVLDRVRGVC